MAFLQLADGRALEYFTNGVTSDRAILFLHGTPADATTWSDWLPEVQSMTAVATSRAGYGLSDRHRGRSVADDIHDQAAVLDHLGITSFVSIGWSGGGPHSINMAREPRCRAAFTLAGVGEFGRDDLDFLEGMGPENQEEFAAALQGESFFTDWLETNAQGMRTVTGPDLIKALGGLLGEADKRALTPKVAEEVAAHFRRALDKSFAGWIDDDLAFVRPFGFELSDIDKPVVIWQGDDDLMVPKAHSSWLAAKIPGSTLRFVPGHGHISLVEEYRATIIQDAIDRL